MKKLMIAPKNKNMILKTIDKVDAYLLGVENFSVNLPVSFSLKEIKEILPILKKENKEIFLSLNKNMFSSDLEPLEKCLEEIEPFSIDGICFYDVSIPSIWKRRHFKTPLVWSQEHFTTNYATSNYWLDAGVSFTQLSNEITKEEIAEIRKNTKMKFISQVFGYIPIFYSKRPLVKNYEKAFSLEAEKEIYYMEKEGKKYPLREQGTSFEGYEATILNAYLDIDTLEVDYLYLNSFLIEDDIFMEILRCYKEKDQASLEKLYPFSSGFLHTKTVYRVKDL